METFIACFLTGILVASAMIAGFIAGIKSVSKERKEKPTRKTKDIKVFKKKVPQNPDKERIDSIK